jgi:hypothetical protein
VTVTLSPAHADLLARTGQRWPDGDEDRIAAMADGWRALGTRLDAVHRDHDAAARSIRRRNSGLAAAAFGEWAIRFDEGLLLFVDICARVEAALLRGARAVLTAKNAILDALDDLAAWLDEAQRRLSGVPVVGGVLTAPLELVEPFVDAARQRIRVALDDVARQLVDDILPALGALVELDKNLVQQLRKLVRGDAGAESPTTPSAAARPGNTPRGTPKVPGPKDAPSTQRGLRLENEAATTLAEAGYDVEQLVPPPGRPVPGRKEPDYRIEGKIFDAYAPTTARAFNIWTRVMEDKVDEGQADRIIINIDARDAQATVDDLRRQFQGHPIPGLKEVKVIDHGGAIVDIYP